MAHEFCYSGSEFDFWADKKPGDLVIYDQHLFVSWLPPDGVKRMTPSLYDQELVIKKLPPFTPMTIIHNSQFMNEVAKIVKTSVTIFTLEKLWWFSKSKLT